MLEAYCDGSITGGPWAPKHLKSTLPHAWSGWWVRDAGGHVLKWRSIDLGEAEYMSANVAEYFAVRSVLSWLNHSVWKNQHIEIISDSQTVIRQMTGQYNCYDKKLILFRDACRAIASHMHVTYRWVRREQNRHADVLSKALQIWGRQATWEEVDAIATGKKSKRSARRSAMEKTESS